MKNTQTISDWTTSLASVLKADRKKGTTEALVDPTFPCDQVDAGLG